MRRRSSQSSHRSRDLKNTQVAQQATALSDQLLQGAFVRPDKTGFWDFLSQSGIEFAKRHFPFLTRTPVPSVKRILSVPEYLELTSKGEALAYLYSGFGKALNYVGPVLDQEMQFGFNDHTDRHTLWVSQTGQELLQRAGVSYDGLSGYDPTTEVLMTLVGMTHDLGNFLSRKDHSTYSAWVLTRMFKRREQHRPEFQAALWAILFHEEPVLRDLGMDLSGGTPLQWALVLADKMHVGRDRIGGRSLEYAQHGALAKDKHILLNALVVRSTWYLGVDTFVWHLDFSVDQLEDKFKVFTKGSDRLWVPRPFQRLFLNEGKRYRETFAQLFRELYGDRMEMAAQAAFLLFPHLKEFGVVLSDNDTRGKVGSAMQVVWGRGR